MKIRLGVVFGGESVEHEVSIISAVQAMYKIDSEKYEVIPLYITKNRKWFTGEILKDMETYQDLDLVKRYCKEVVLYEMNGRFVLQSKGFLKKIVGEVDIILPIVHGTNVEDGVLQGYLQSIGVPYALVDVTSAAVGQDKVFMKDIFSANHLPIVKHAWLYDVEYDENKDAVVEKVTSQLKFPVIVKPATLGSSVGIKVAKTTEELIEAIDDAVSYDKKIVVEEVVQNLVEVNISVLGNYESQKVSAIEKVIPTKDILTYADKYIGNGKGKLKGKCRPAMKSKGMLSASRIIPADISKKLQEEVEQVAIEAFKTLGSSGVVRIDFLIDEKKEKVYINEINSIPGSLAFYLWNQTGVDYTSLLDEVINIGIRDYKKRVSKTHSFDTNILKGYTSLGGVKGLKGMKGKLR